MKIMIVPSEYVTDLHNRRRNKILGIISNIRRLNLKDAYAFYKSHYLSTEHYYYGDIVNVIGYDNVAIVGKYYKEYLSQKMDPYTSYPSLCNTPAIREISYMEALNEINQFDVIFLGGRCGVAGDAIRTEALKKDKFIVQLDYQDDKEIYKNPTDKTLTRGKVYGRDYHIYFKHDIPLGMPSERVKPIAPMPIRINNYPQINCDWIHKIDNVFYSGRIAHGARSDRVHLVNKISRAVPKSNIKYTEANNITSISEYAGNLSRAKIALTPSGKVWDSTRHCEVGVYNCAPLIPEPDCEIVGSTIKNGINAISYQMKLSNLTGELEINDVDELVDQINEYLSNNHKLKLIAENWSSEVKTNHTTLARAEYLVNCISKSWGL